MEIARGHTSAKQQGTKIIPVFLPVNGRVSQMGSTLVGDNLGKMVENQKLQKITKSTILRQNHGQKCFSHLLGDKPLWGIYTFIISFL